MIGVFDSGLGGLSVLAAIARELPQANLIYLADTAHVPYGDKPDNFITGRVLAIGQHLADQGCKLIVAACNTATTTAIQALREHLPHIQVVGVEPGVKPAAQGSLKRHIAVLATETTARSKRLAHLIDTHAAQVKVDVVPCPGWATHVETLQPDTPAFRAEVEQKIRPLLDAGVDRIVLGCTHYAFLIPIIEPLLEGRAQLVDVADAVARQVLRLRGDSYADGKISLQATVHPERLSAALPALSLNKVARRVASVTQVSV
ncbi:MAG: glutamate racemase [Rhodocyclaceae bacterium]|nr:glutamate racemase [Rhodocyclaceae bacterium]MDZ4213488.1 glutamate racemase [Rhodocyclaceae bacterium]